MDIQTFILPWLWCCSIISISYRKWRLSQTWFQNYRLTNCVWINISVEDTTTLVFNVEEHSGVHLIDVEGNLFLIFIKNYKLDIDIHITHESSIIIFHPEIAYVQNVIP